MKIYTKDGKIYDCGGAYFARNIHFEGVYRAHENKCTVTVQRAKMFVLF